MEARVHTKSISMTAFLLSEIGWEVNSKRTSRGAVIADTADSFSVLENVLENGTVI
jgi:hypothetical protein